MAGLCALTASGLTVLLLAGDGFSLAWTHSIEKTLWRETWAITAAGFAHVRSTVEGSGAGMTVPEGAVRVEEGGRRAYAFTLPLTVPEIALANSGYTPDHLVCPPDRPHPQGCRALDHMLPAQDRDRPVVLRPCRE